MTASLTAESLDLHGVNKVVFDRLVAQLGYLHPRANEDDCGWVCGCTLRKPAVGGLAAHTRLSEIRKALRAAVFDVSNPVPKRATTCAVCKDTAELSRSFGHTPSTTYAYRISPELHDLVLAGREGRAAA